MKTLTQQLLESFDSDINKIDIQIKGLGYDTKAFDNGDGSYIIETKLENGTTHLPQVLERFNASLKGRANLIMIDCNVGNETGNYYRLVFPNDEQERNLVYHVTSKKWVQSIKEQGLLKMRPTEGTDSLEHYKNSESFKERLYKASFVLGDMKDAREVQKMFKFDDPQLITLDARGMTLYRDPMMPQSMDCLISFKGFEPHRIQAVAQMY